MQTTPSLPVHITQFADVITRAEYRASSAELDGWMVGGHPDEAYTEFLTAAVVDIAVIPVEREAVDLPLVEADDETSLMDTLKRIISIAALTFHRSLSDTERDLVHIMKEFPTADVREAASLRHQGKLH
jgi:hypothetical protein